MVKTKQKTTEPAQSIAALRMELAARRRELRAVQEEADQLRADLGPPGELSGSAREEAAALLAESDRRVLAASAQVGRAERALELARDRQALPTIEAKFEKTKAIADLRQERAQRIQEHLEAIGEEMRGLEGDADALLALTSEGGGLAIRLGHAMHPVARRSRFLVPLNAVLAHTVYWKRPLYQPDERARNFAKAESHVHSQIVGALERRVTKIRSRIEQEGGNDDNVKRTA